MKKRVIIGDVHGNKGWKQIVKRHDDADEFIFVGDYLDPYGTSQRRVEDLLKCADNFKKIVKFKRENPDRVTLLIGNHDYHYLPNVSAFEACSRYDKFFKEDCGDIFADLLKNFEIQIIKEFDGVLVSHAGVSPFWYNKHKKIWKYQDAMEATNPSNIADNINKALITNRNIFGFDHNDRSGYGDSIYQGPCWIRPAALNSAMDEFDFRDILPQVVGHTSVPKIFNCGKTHPIWMIDNQKTKYTELVFSGNAPQL
jgi:predicted phosphodiesterase